MPQAANSAGAQRYPVHSARFRDVLILVALLCGIVGSFPQSAVAISGGEVIAKVQQKLEDYKTFSARFEKQFYWAALDKESSRKGRIYMLRPGRFRVEVEKGDLVVADGEAIWAYVKKNGQVVVSHYEGELKTPWEVLLDYSKDYTPVAVDEVELEGRSCYLLTLKPQSSSSVVTHMKVWVERKRWLLLRVEQLEANENLTTYILKDHKTNKKIDAALFQFAIPDGVEVIDRRDPVAGND